jgi:hypothetical protein
MRSLALLALGSAVVQGALREPSEVEHASLLAALFPLLPPAAPFQVRGAQMLRASAPTVGSVRPRRVPSPVASGPVVNEFSRLVSVTAFGRRATRSTIAATPEERAALAARFGLVGIASLEANVSCAVVDPRLQRVRAYGTITARDVMQEEVGVGPVTLQVTQAPFESFFMDKDAAGYADAARAKYSFDEEGSYDEPLEDGQIDLGELVAQHLYLHLCELGEARLLE